MRNRNATLAGLLAALLLISSAIACSEIVPEYMPSPPQMTAGALNSTYEASWTATANATASPSSTPTGSGLTATPTPEPSPRPAPRPSPTSSIIEVTPLGGEPTPPIVILGNANEPPKPGVWVWARGTYYSYEAWNVRACEDKACAIVGGLSAGQTVETVGGTVDAGGALWLCMRGGEDVRGAQWCDRVFLAWQPVVGWNGIYEVID